MGIRWTKQPNGKYCFVETFRDTIYLNLPESETYFSELYDWEEFVKTVNYWYDIDFEEIYNRLKDKGKCHWIDDKPIEYWNDEFEVYL